MCSFSVLFWCFSILFADKWCFFPPQKNEGKIQVWPYMSGTIPYAHNLCLMPLLALLNKGFIWKLSKCYAVSACFFKLFTPVIVAHLGDKIQTVNTQIFHFVSKDKIWKRLCSAEYVKFRNEGIQSDISTWFENLRGYCILLISYTNRVGWRSCDRLCPSVCTGYLKNLSMDFDGFILWSNRPRTRFWGVSCINILWYLLIHIFNVDD